VEIDSAWSTICKRAAETLCAAELPLSSQNRWHHATPVLLKPGHEEFLKTYVHNDDAELRP
jgi:hypothetical protein